MENNKDADMTGSAELSQKNVGRSRFKRILALIGVILLVLMYILCLIFAIMNFDGWQRYFMACIACTIAIPILLWINIFLYDRMMDRRKGKQE